MIEERISYYEGLSQPERAQKAIMDFPTKPLPMKNIIELHTTETLDNTTGKSAPLQINTVSSNLPLKNEGLHELSANTVNNDLEVSAGKLEPLEENSADMAIDTSELSTAFVPEDEEDIEYETIDWSQLEDLLEDDEAIEYKAEQAERAEIEVQAEKTMLPKTDIPLTPLIEVGHEDISGLNALIISTKLKFRKLKNIPYLLPKLSFSGRSKIIMGQRVNSEMKIKVGRVVRFNDDIIEHSMDDYMERMIEVWEEKAKCQCFVHKNQRRIQNAWTRLQSHFSIQI
jgi:hypothetical protein